MRKEITTKVYLSINGEYQCWDNLAQEKQKELAIKLNGRAIKAIGFTHSKKST